ncbi:XRE family transcriptional regulator [Streptomyces sp. NBC_00690]|uniref:XRE family transcriptional regulator n=1 Tax=Streptomyces sp. NBC_00690 TaxID=2975808 RepID=UPI002E2C452D|nr:XRE family transcriptional regulator [Streptomyces sp. NBC_00690]
MGRHERAVAAHVKQAGTLALWLRAQRQRAGCTYAAMSETLNHRYSASMLSRAASGRLVPSHELVLAYVQACGGNQKHATRLWKEARWAEEEHKRRQGTPHDFRDLAAKVGRALAHPEVIENFGQLRRAMIQLRAREGQPSLGTLQARAGRKPCGTHRLPKSSLSAILRGETPPLRDHLTAFMTALGMSARKVEEWELAWDRIVANEGRGTRRSQPDRYLPKARPGRLPYLLYRAFRSSDPDPPLMAMLASLPERFAMTESDLVYLKSHSIPPRTLQELLLPRTWSGPQQPNPQAGVTRSGLPIRNPRRYNARTPPRTHVVRTRSEPLDIPLLTLT